MGFTKILLGSLYWFSRVRRPYPILRAHIYKWHMSESILAYSYSRRPTTSFSTFPLDSTTQMATAAAISLSIAGVGRLRNLSSVNMSGNSQAHFVSSLSPSSAAQPPHSLKLVLDLRHPCAPRIRAAATSSSVSIESPASFLEHKETGILHFVKYQGLGNDFILVRHHTPIFAGLQT